MVTIKLFSFSPFEGIQSTGEILASFQGSFNLPWLFFDESEINIKKKKKKKKKNAEKLNKIHNSLHNKMESKKYIYTKHTFYPNEVICGVYFVNMVK